MSIDKTAIQAVVDAVGLTVHATFVPFSRSRNAKPNPKLVDLSLNWKVTVKHNGRDVITTDYQAGIGHAPCYKQGSLSVDEAEAIREECENGKQYWNPGTHARFRFGPRPIMPDHLNVLHSLASDSDVIDHPGFESWARDLGYDVDSRKAEATYRACLDIALKLRAAIGEDGLAKLREAFQDY